MIEPPVISELVPHAGRMLLLERLLDSGADYVTCEVLVRADGMFDRDGRVPAWLGVEYMAQTIAAYSGLQAQASGQPLRLCSGVDVLKLTCKTSSVVRCCRYGPSACWPGIAAWGLLSVPWRARQRASERPFRFTRRRMAWAKWNRL